MTEPETPQTGAGDGASGPDLEKVRREWSARARFWDRQADTVAGMADRFNQPLIDAAGILPGMTVLDLASGAGEPALQIARLLGPEGRLMATDLVPEMLAVARRRAAAQGLGNIEFHEADMQALPFADAAFDRVTCRFGIMSCPDAGRAMAETHRVLRPGGRAAFMVWGPRANTTIFVVFAAAAEAVFGPEPGVNLKRAFRFGEAGSLTGPMTAAGFDQVSEIELRFSPKIPTGRPFWLPQQDMMFGARLQQATAAEAEALDRAIREGMERHVRDGAWHLEAHARIVTGERR